MYLLRCIHTRGEGNVYRLSMGGGTVTTSHQNQKAHVPMIFNEHHPYPLKHSQLSQSLI
uniref:Uncharacterized protein n=1 Tax=Anguilla anguilla TaxID=7936 RepID=A0A0E9RED8_ANGAN